MNRPPPFPWSRTEVAQVNSLEGVHAVLLCTSLSYQPHLRWSVYVRQEAGDWAPGSSGKDLDDALASARRQYRYYRYTRTDDDGVLRTVARFAPENDDGLPGEALGCFLAKEALPAPATGRRTRRPGKKAATKKAAAKKAAAKKTAAKKPLRAARRR